MQLKEIQISNVLSFGFQKNFGKREGVVFDTGEKWRVNILIGPNGSGKSSFLEVVNQVIKNGVIKNFVYNREFASDASKKRQTIVQQQPKILSLEKHSQHFDKKSQVALKIVLNKNDYDNLSFLCSYRQEINEIIRDFSKFDLEFPAVRLDDLLFHNEVDFEFGFDFDRGRVQLRGRDRSPEEEFIFLFVQNIQLIQIVMNLHNDFVRENVERKWYPLKNTFAVLGADRNVEALGARDLVMSAREKSVLLASQNTKTDASIGYKLCMSKIIHELYDCLHEYDGDLQACVVDVLPRMDFFQGLQDFVRKYLNLELGVVQENEDFYFGIRSKTGKLQPFHSLSAGQQSMLLIMLTIYGYDVENWLLVIDEPELHLHPQMQETFMEMIRDVAKKMKIQFIIATHSPLMINEQNIDHVYKFSLKKGETVIHNPQNFFVSSSESNLVHMLRFENVAKVFFVDKILMVEGETDAYFLDFFLKFLRQQSEEWFHKISNFEVIHINGKGGYRRRQKFLKRFGLEAYFLGDWDNVFETHIVEDPAMIKRLPRSAPKHVFGRYGNVVYNLEKKFPSEHQRIVGRIKKLYDDNIFILQKGDLETYLQIKNKGLEDVIDFCRTRFAERRVEGKTKKFREELEGIVAHIFTEK